MSGDDVEFWWVHEVDTQTYLGSGGRGDRWADPDPEPLACWVEEGIHIVRDRNGNEVTSTAIVRAALEDRPRLEVDNKVTLTSGRTSRVLSLLVRDSGSLDLGLDHVEAHLA